MTALAIAVHWVHVLAGLVWFGGQVFVFAALWPALLRLSGPSGRALFQAIVPTASRLMGPAGSLVLVTGIVRGTWLGPVRSWRALGTAYGLTFVGSLALVVALSAYSGRTRATFAARVWTDDGAYRADAGAFLRRQGTIAIGGLSIVLGGMVLMRFGL